MAHHFYQSSDHPIPGLCGNACGYSHYPAQVSKNKSVFVEDGASIVTVTRTKRIYPGLGALVTVHTSFSTQSVACIFTGYERFGHMNARGIHMSKLHFRRLLHCCIQLVPATADRAIPVTITRWWVKRQARPLGRAKRTRQLHGSSLLLIL